MSDLNAMPYYSVLLQPLSKRYLVFPSSITCLFGPAFPLPSPCSQYRITLTHTPNLPPSGYQSKPLTFSKKPSTDTTEQGPFSFCVSLCQGNGITDRHAWPLTRLRTQHPINNSPTNIRPLGEPHHQLQPHSNPTATIEVELLMSTNFCSSTKD